MGIIVVCRRQQVDWRMVVVLWTLLLLVVFLLDIVVVLILFCILCIRFVFIKYYLTCFFAVFLLWLIVVCRESFCWCFFQRFAHCWLVVAWLVTVVAFMAGCSPSCCSLLFVVCCGGVVFHLCVAVLYVVIGWQCCTSFLGAIVLR